MKRFIFLIVALIFGITTSFAQDDFLGGNSSMGSSMNIPNFLKIDNDTKPFRVGGYLNWDFMFVTDLPSDATSFGFRPEIGVAAYAIDVLYLGTGLGYWHQSLFDYYGYDVESNYLYIPIQIGIQFNVHKNIGVFCNTGPQFGWIVGQKMDDDKVDLSDYDSDDKKFTDWNVRFGLKLWGVDVYATYQKGLSGCNEDVELWGFGVGGRF